MIHYMLSVENMNVPTAMACACIASMISSIKLYLLFWQDSSFRKRNAFQSFSNIYMQVSIFFIHPFDLFSSKNLLLIYVWVYIVFRLMWLCSIVIFSYDVFLIYNSKTGIGNIIFHLWYQIILKFKFRMINTNI